VFVNGIMLAGVGGAVVPLAVHLLNRSRARTVKWGAMMFLEGGRPSRVASTRLKEWSLLAVRMGLIAALAMALSRPVASATWTGGSTGPVTLVVVLDRSASMGMIENGHARFETARSTVLAALGALHKGDAAALVLMGDGGASQLFADPTTDLSAVTAYVSGLGVFVWRSGHRVGAMAGRGYSGSKPGGAGAIFCWFRIGRR
jgi:hypothetical protein